MAKIKMTATIEEATEKMVVKIAKEDNRNYSNTVDTLLSEAILARVIKSTKKKK